MSQVTVYEDARKSPDAKIVEILRDKAGLNPEGKGREELLQLCRENDIHVISKDEEKNSSAKSKANEGKKPTGYTINIPGTKDRKQVPVGVNGPITLIKCDVDVRVKPAIVEVLRNAKEDFIEFVQDPRTSEVVDVIKRPVQAIPFQIVETHYE